MIKIATIYTPFKEKFGIPRQGGLVNSKAKIVFEKEFSRTEAFNGLKDYSHIWVLWEFSENLNKPWSPTVRPPRLGGNKRVGVFSTRSPFRPNPIGLTCLRLLGITTENDRIVLTVEGADMLDKTPVYDVKPYVPHCDLKPDAVGGFSDEVKDYKLSVSYDEKIFNDLDDNLKNQIIEILKQDPRPSYQNDFERVYGFYFDDYEIKFNVSEDFTANIISIKKHRIWHGVFVLYLIFHAYEYIKGDLYARK